MNILDNKIIQYLLVLGVGGILVELGFMAVVSASVTSAIVVMGSLCTLVAIVWIFTSMGRRG